MQQLEEVAVPDDNNLDRQDPKEIPPEKETIDNSRVSVKDFVILKELGKGGFGSVFLVRITD